MSTQSVDSAITEAVIFTNNTVFGESPNMALASAQQVAAHAIGLAMENAVANQQNLNVMLTATVASSVAAINSLGEAENAKS